MIKAKKLGPQSELDFLRDNMPAYAFPQEAHLKTNSPVNKRHKHYTETRMSADRVNNLRDQAHRRQLKSTMRRTLLQMKSNQPCTRVPDCIVDNPERLIVSYTPVHLVNGIDNGWNHLEQTDAKHLAFIYGEKTFKRQKQAIKMIDQRIDAEIEVQNMKTQARTQFRWQLLSNMHSKLASKLTTQQNGIDNNETTILKPPKSNRYKQHEYRHMILTSMEELDNYNSKHLNKHISTHADYYSEHNQRSKSFQSQPTRSSKYDNYNRQLLNDSVDREIDNFEVKLKSVCGMLQRKPYQYDC